MDKIKETHDPKDRVQHNPFTDAWHIDGGKKAYNSEQTARNALANYLKRGGK